MRAWRLASSNRNMMRKNMIDRFLRSENSRTALLKKNILGSLVFKGWCCVAQLLLVPVTLSCLTQYEYGIWLTVNSILVWIDTFDIGLGNGLRNRLAQALAQGDTERGRRQVSTTFIMLAVIIIPVVLSLMAVIRWADCYAFFNVDRTCVPHLDELLMVSVAMVGATFVLKFIGNVFLALQLPAVNNLIVALGQTLAFVGILVLSLLYRHISLFAVALVYTVSPLVVYLCAYPLTFHRYPMLRPGIRFYDRAELDGLFGLGVKFFLVQMSGMVIFTTSNILISRLFSPLEVTPYQVVNRYFGLVNILFTLISAPLWSATTDAYTRGDWPWIVSTVRKMNRIVWVLCAFLVVMLCMAHPVYRLWVGEKVQVPFVMSAAMAVYMAVVLYGTCYSNILCGIGKIRMHTIVSVTQACIYIPLAVRLAALYGVEGIVYALIITTLISAVTNKVQFEMLASHRAYGIFDK